MARVPARVFGGDRVRIVFSFSGGGGGGAGERSRKVSRSMKTSKKETHHSFSLGFLFSQKNIYRCLGMQAVALLLNNLHR